MCNTELSIAFSSFKQTQQPKHSSEKDYNSHCSLQPECNTTRKAPSISQCFSKCDLWPAAAHRVLEETCNYLH
jgi:hypothetical protein